MAVSEKMAEFKLKHNTDVEFAKKFDLACKKVFDESKDLSDCEIFSAAARELGYDLSPSEFERTKAETEDLDAEELQMVSGGQYYPCPCEANNCTVVEICWSDNFCITASNTTKMDENGHNNICVVGWHCYTAALHTESDNRDMACWSNYTCLYGEHIGGSSYDTLCWISDKKSD